MKNPSASVTCRHLALRAATRDLGRSRGPRLAALFLTVMASSMFLSSASVAATVQGRVSNKVTSAGLSRAAVSVPGTNRETLTDDDGFYRLGGVDGDQVELKVNYHGFKSKSVTVTVGQSDRVVQDFELLRDGLTSSTDGDEEIVVLGEYEVVAEREMTAQAISMNEQKHAANIKSVVAYDEYGDQGSEHIGEFLRFLPSVALNDAGLVANEITLRGFPAEHTQVAMDGGQLTGARSGNTRKISVLEIPTANISRIEVNKVPTPDMSASGLGGSLNIITKSGFERKEPQFNYKLYMLMNTRDAEVLGGGPSGQARGTSASYKEPSFSFDYQIPLNDSLALTAGATRTWRQLPYGSTDESPTWNLVDLFQRASNWQDIDQILKTQSGQLGLEWRITEQDTLSVKANVRESQSYITRNTFNVNYGSGAAGDANHTQGRSAGTGSVRMNTGSADNLVATSLLTTVKYTHRGDVWRIDAGGSFNHANYQNENVQNGHVGTIDARATNLVIRGEGIGEGGAAIATRYSATDRSGSPVDLYDGGSYTLNSIRFGAPDYNTYRTMGNLDFTREFYGQIPFTLKSGVAVDRLERQRFTIDRTWNFRPNGSASASDRLAGNFDLFDEEYNSLAPSLYGEQVRWISKQKVYDLFVEHPEWFQENLITTHRNLANNRLRLVETVSAAYLRGDVRLFDNRLWVVAGARYEHTRDSGFGPLFEPSNKYQMNGDGSLVDGDPTTDEIDPVLITTDPLEQERLTRIAKGSKVRRSYDDFYPSINSSFSITPDLLIRAAYARTIGRPNSNYITPGTTVSEPTATTPTITVNNPSLQPWTADNFDLTLEAYDIKGAFASIGVFQKNISNFFGSSRTAVTPELLEQYGLIDDGQFTDYELITRYNVGDAKILGAELSYRQKLKFLPGWGQDLQVFFNATRMKLSGSNAAEFSGFNPSSYSAGINFVRPRFYVKLTATYQDETRRNLQAVSSGNGIPIGTYNYEAERTRINLAAQYSFSKRLSVFGTIADLGGGFDPERLRYAPDTPEYAKTTRLQRLGSTIRIGIKGEF